MHDNIYFQQLKDFTHVNYKSYQRLIKRFIFIRSSIKKGERLAKITPQRAGGVRVGSKNKKVPKSLRQILTSSCFFFSPLITETESGERKSFSLYPVSSPLPFSVEASTKKKTKNCTRQAFRIQKKVCQTKKKHQLHKSSKTLKSTRDPKHDFASNWEIVEIEFRLSLTWFHDWFICGHSLTGQIKRQHLFSAHDIRVKCKYLLMLANSYSVISLTKPFDGCTSTLWCTFGILK